MKHFYLAPEFWLAVAFLIFVCLVFKPIKAAILNFLDLRSLRIKQDIEEMNKLMAELGYTLSEIKDKYDAIDKELAEIAKNTEREIGLLKANADKEITQYINQKTHQLLEKMASDERKSLEKLRTDAVKVAIKVSSDLIKNSVDQKFSEHQIENSLKIIKEKL